ncbi:hypothetical protein K466DRAFT_264991 [Polyporus arcularius HHB13444]|uniref:Uncharacterized protein n=1 Tax=Polyporus arcularius HHB13444 TaxID=1314778 RepID=A0A5C3P135_9APHY|nr:hypothetical protein K466DRAFT_264991 [Polyporus arcularius HHB13444]
MEVSQADFRGEGPRAAPWANRHGHRLEQYCEDLPTAAKTHLSHLSLLFLHGSQLIAFRARLGGGRASGPPLSAESAVPFAPGERTRTCFVLGADPELEPDAATVDRWPFELPACVAGILAGEKGAASGRSRRRGRRERLRLGGGGRSGVSGRCDVDVGDDNGNRRGPAAMGALTPRRLQPRL